ncbi:hypothetical protein TTHERM_000807998 (macronuclear) [Tetrahymena thermophila SB210]|uniref:Uncharacterized protein n=1 Tax=Tetrahymena thermophila (strain SB210) TaxID=312017 RepID=W7XJE6_TETTS|nr:hypothetical protein TTHERM_000807998 [Tetrahymena thermophila SB210]EWS75456.1 hypothetical protein TTHERM_000807998 [Tetrahymena thermophila SB210]|eukprot:XP_012652003.1 hypothetical protein TTHERM_000807998 [Tetrahymena thermophila SB210]
MLNLVTLKKEKQQNNQITRASFSIIIMKQSNKQFTLSNRQTFQAKQIIQKNKKVRKVQEIDEEKVKDFKYDKRAIQGIQRQQCKQVIASYFDSFDYFNFQE